MFQSSDKVWDRPSITWDKYSNLWDRLSSRSTNSARQATVVLFTVTVFWYGAGCATPSGGSGGAWLSRNKGTPWTIRVMETRGEYAVSNAQRLADMLRQVKGIKVDEVTVEHDADGMSRIYYGTYYRKLDVKTGILPIPPELGRDLQVIRLLQADDGSRYFAMASKVPKPQPNLGNPAWALERVTEPYTLQVAVFEAREIPQFKKAAVQHCENLRRKGYEAYYYHQDSASLVTVGAFGRDAVRLVGGRVIYSQEVIDLQNKELFKYNITNGRKLTVHRDGQSSPVLSQLRVVPGNDPIEMEAWTAPRR